MTGFVRKASAALTACGLLWWPATLAGVANAAPVDYGDLSSLAGDYLAARTADVEKDIPNAALFYRSALKSDPDNLYFLERALVLTAASGDVPEAVGFARGLKRQAPNSHPARLVLAVDLIGQKKYADAAAMLDGGGAGSSVGVVADLTTALIVAWAYSGQGEVEKAVAELQKLKGEPWYEPFKFLHIGYVDMAAGRLPDALKAFARARELDPNAVRITEAYARALAVAGRRDEAERALDDFLARFPDNPLARAALQDVRAGKAREQMVATPAAGTAEALAGIGGAVGQQGGVEVALLYLRLALHLDPNIAGGLAAFSLGNLLDASGQGEAAITLLLGVPADAPFRSLSVLRAAVALDRLDRTAEAEKSFQEAVERNPGDIQTYLSYGNMLRGRDRFAEAAAIYSKAIERIGAPGRSDWTLFYFRGIAYERTHDWVKAEPDFKKALELYPDQPFVLNYLGYSWVDMGRNLDQAMAMIRKAVELRPNDGYIVDSLGWAYYRLARYDDAVAELEKAVSLKPDDPVMHDHLGDAYWKAGRVLEAQFQWRHARDLGAEGAQLALILRKIAERRLIEERKDAASQPGAPTPGATRG